jgi:hypothetical protein
LPYVVPDDRERLLEGVQRVVPDEDGELLKVGLDAAPDVTTYDNLVRRLDNQRDAVAALAAQMGLPFADLTPAFQREAAQGEILYYIYDTHWNQAGHDLAGAVLADFVADNPCGA